jgi:hypothetical protein
MSPLQGIRGWRLPGQRPIGFHLGGELKASIQIPPVEIEY